MATWQFDLSFIPTDNLNIKLRKDEDNLIDFSSMWLKNQPPENYAEVISKFLPLSKSWSENILLFGKEDETCIHVCLENKNVVAISARIDLRTLDYKVLNKIIDLAKQLNCNLYLSESEKIMENNYEKLVGGILESNAAEFVKNPLEFIKKLKSNLNN